LCQEKKWLRNFVANCKKRERKKRNGSERKDEKISVAKCESRE
jgi:hypothetical protein